MNQEKKINRFPWEYALYFLVAALAAGFFYLSRGIQGSEHLLSAWQIFQGGIPYTDFFEHHGPLQYYLLAPLFYLGGYKFFPLWMIIINSSICVLAIRYFFKVFSFGIKERLIIAAIFIWVWTAMFGSTFLPEPYITLLVILIYSYFLKIKYQDSAKNIYLAILGFLFGALFLIKFNAFVFLSLGFLAYCLLNFKKEKILIDLKNIFLFLAGMILPFLPFLYIYRDKLKEVAYWMFAYNFEVVSPLARIWPPKPLSLFFLILSANIIILLLIFFNEEIKEKYYKLTFPIISSLYLLLVSYPRYGDSHLLPAMLGFLTGVILFFKEKLYRFFLVKIFDRKKYIAKASVILILLYIFLSSINFIFSLSKETYRIFWSRPGEFYYSSFAPGGASSITEKEKCRYIYIYPADQYNLPMYIELPEVKRVKFIYPNWVWTFTENIQKMIIAELANKSFDCILVTDKSKVPVLHSQAIEDYIINNYHKTGEATLRVYSFKTLLPFKFITDYKKNGEDFTYSLFKINAK